MEFLGAYRVPMSDVAVLWDIITPTHTGWEKRINRTLYYRYTIDGVPGWSADVLLHSDIPEELTDAAARPIVLEIWSRSRRYDAAKTLRYCVRWATSRPITAEGSLIFVPPSDGGMHAELRILGADGGVIRTDKLRYRPEPVDPAAQFVQVYRLHFDFLGLTKDQVKMWAADFAAQFEHAGPQSLATINRRASAEIARTARRDGWTAVPYAQMQRLFGAGTEKPVWQPAELMRAAADAHRTGRQQAREKLVHVD